MTQSFENNPLDHTPVALPPVAESGEDASQFPVIEVATKLDRVIDEFHLPTSEYFALGQELRKHVIQPGENDEADVYRDKNGQIISDKDSALSVILRTALVKTDPETWILPYTDFAAKRTLRSHLAYKRLTPQDRIELKPYMQAFGKEGDAETDILESCRRFITEEIRLSAKLRHERSQATEANPAGKPTIADKVPKDAARRSNKPKENQVGKQPTAKNEQAEQPKKTKQKKGTPFNGTFHRIELESDPQGGKHIYVYDENGNRRPQPVGADKILELYDAKARLPQKRPAKKREAAIEPDGVSSEAAGTTIKPTNTYLATVGGRVALGRHMSAARSDEQGRFKSPESSDNTYHVQKAQFAGKQAINAPRE